MIVAQKSYRNIFYQRKTKLIAIWARLDQVTRKYFEFLLGNRSFCFFYDTYLIEHCSILSIHPNTPVLSTFQSFYTVQFV